MQRVPSTLATLDQFEMWPWVVRMASHVPLHAINPKAAPFDLAALAEERQRTAADVRVIRT